MKKVPKNTYVGGMSISGYTKSDLITQANNLEYNANLDPFAWDSSKLRSMAQELRSWARRLE